MTGEFEVDLDDGGTYEGYSLDGKADGDGTYTAPDGKTKSGIWRNGKFFGEKHNGHCRVAVSELSNGATSSDPVAGGGIYEGSCVNNMAHGYGVYTAPDGKTVSGVWSDGALLERGGAPSVGFLLRSKLHRLAG